ncbi:hypothetical protein DACRYDRAFT_78409 [Dacryopinax primogenitus]|uniref:SH3 domain-containing protein n=1 Tax=Dacryopinax primogenitus (strain DJM 731) TaxID=1858805 RepID=M5G9N4_DACPD|nr:uncharacterized protein DACRYDRAFT_78409 [Dacryopinax primogenitus]EJU02577.1 hypothetical protein DACRYDRAFT_78409 [Dacryopinax primogenitus]
MPARGGDGYDFRPIVTHYLFLFTFILAAIGWLVSFVSQCAVEAQWGNGPVGVLWFAIFLQLALIIGVFHSLATDSIATHRLQISVFGGVMIVFAVNGANVGIFGGAASEQAMGAGYLILAIVDIVWVLYFTAEEDSYMYHIFQQMGSGGLSGPSRGNRRRTRTSTMGNMGISSGGGNGYASGGYSNADVGGGGIGGPGSLTGGFGAPKSSFGDHRDSKPISGVLSNPGSQPGAAPTAASEREANGSITNQSQPLMSTGDTAQSAGDTYAYRARALYAYTASPDDPNEITFVKGEVMDILDNTGKWWQARKQDGSTGIAPSNYLQLI